MSRAALTHRTADEIEAAFYDALARADIDALMALWADDEDIVCIHPNAARLVGHAAIRASWEAIFARGGVHIRPCQLHVAQNMLTAMHSVIEEIHQAGGTPTDVHVLATNLYLKTAQGWRMALHHASVAPGAIAGELPAATLLH